MSTYSAPSGTFTFSQTLTANSADQVTLADRAGYVSVTNTGTAVMFARADGQSAVAAAKGTIAVMPGTSALLANGLELWYPFSKVIPAGASLIPVGGGAAPVATSPTDALIVVKRVVGDPRRTAVTAVIMRP